jgi:hypothetical protein
VGLLWGIFIFLEIEKALIDSGMAVKYDGGKKNTSWCE